MERSTLKEQRTVGSRSRHCWRGHSRATARVWSARYVEFCCGNINIRTSATNLYIAKVCSPRQNPKPDFAQQRRARGSRGRCERFRRCAGRLVSTRDSGFRTERPGGTCCRDEKRSHRAAPRWSVADRPPGSSAGRSRRSTGPGRVP